MTSTSAPNTPMLAYHSDPRIKTRYLKRVRQHAKMDEIVKDRYWENGKGCAVGCTIHGSDHTAYERELGIPATIAYLEDTIFENLPNGKALAWPARFLSAIRPGADLGLVTARFMFWLLLDENDGVIKHTKEGSEQRTVINTVGALYARVLAGDVVTRVEWEQTAMRSSMGSSKGSKDSSMGSRGGSRGGSKDSTLRKNGRQINRTAGGCLKHVRIR